MNDVLGGDWAIMRRGSAAQVLEWLAARDAAARREGGDERAEHIAQAIDAAADNMTDIVARLGARESAQIARESR